MNKKEKAIFDEAIYSAKLANAFRRTEEILKDVPKPSYDNPQTTFGFDFNQYSFSVNEYYSGTTRHGIARDGIKSTGTASQGGVNLFSTKVLALKAMRHAIENECAAKLLKIDEMIKREL